MTGNNFIQRNQYLLQSIRELSILCTCAWCYDQWNPHTLLETSNPITNVQPRRRLAQCTYASRRVLLSSTKIFSLKRARFSYACHITAYYRPLVANGRIKCSFREGLFPSMFERARSGGFEWIWGASAYHSMVWWLLLILMNFSVDCFNCHGSLGREGVYSISLSYRYEQAYPDGMKCIVSFSKRKRSILFLFYELEWCCS